MFHNKIYFWKASEDMIGFMLGMLDLERSGSFPAHFLRYVIHQIISSLIGSIDQTN